jgi:hypothetical protein
MKKTPIDWIRKELEYFREFEQFYTNNYMQIDALFNEAKEIEKQQTMDAWLNGYKEAIDDVKQEMKSDNIDDLNTPNFGILK